MDQKEVKRYDCLKFSDNYWKILYFKRSHFDFTMGTIFGFSVAAIIGILLVLWWELLR